MITIEEIREVKQRMKQRAISNIELIEENYKSLDQESSKILS